MQRTSCAQIAAGPLPPVPYMTRRCIEAGSWKVAREKTGVS